MPPSAAQPRPLITRCSHIFCSCCFRQWVQQEARTRLELQGFWLMWKKLEKTGCFSTGPTSFKYLGFYLFFFLAPWQHDHVTSRHVEARWSFADQVELHKSQNKTNGAPPVAVPSSVTDSLFFPEISCFFWWLKHVKNGESSIEMGIWSWKIDMVFTMFSHVFTFAIIAFLLVIGSLSQQLKLRIAKIMDWERMPLKLLACVLYWHAPE